MTVPPDFGGHEFEEGLLEDLGGPHEKHPAPHGDQAGSDWDDNELHAVGQVCALCGATITAGQDAAPRRRQMGPRGMSRYLLTTPSR